MIQDFTRDEPEAAHNSTELTLGGGALLALGGGLLVLCAICFGLGYEVGHRETDRVAANDDAIPSSRSLEIQPRGGVKPGAHGQSPNQGPKEQNGNGSSQEDRPEIDSPHAADSLQSHPDGVGQTGQDLSSPAFRVQSASRQPQGWMVQIAAVSHSEDAEVLVGALRKRGYAAIARRDVSDSLIHVQTGPFVNRNDANEMRQKLLSDGYNAIVQ
jgi:cell division septation protein DedD